MGTVTDCIIIIGFVITIFLSTKCVAETCPNGKDCPGHSICCQLVDKSYGCCPYSGGICCKDHIHCCPKSMKCNIKSQKCDNDYYTMALKVLSSNDAFDIQENNEIKFIDKNEIMDQNKILNSNNFQIMEHNTIVDEGVTTQRSTPYNYILNHIQDIEFQNNEHISNQNKDYDDNLISIKNDDYEDSGTLIQDSLDIPYKVNDYVLTFQNLSENIGYQEKCRDGRVCKNETCCRVKSGHYGCCPFQNAVCCPDKIYCCPNGFSCEEYDHMCNPERTNVERIQSHKIKQNEDTSKTIKQNLESPLENIRSSIFTMFDSDTRAVCPDGNQCFENYTCCKMPRGNYGCCPYKEAMCCEDRVYCCPHGFACDLDDDRCIQIEPIFIPEKHYVAKAKCPDGHTCADKTTCCNVGDDTYGCCPFPNAVCCSDKVHCCPSGYTCNLKENTCVKKSYYSGMVEILMAKKAKILEHISQEFSACPDGRVCPSNYTCCKNKIGQYGCCPYKQGTCCIDGIHCCPSDYKCDSIHKRCIHRYSFLELFGIFNLYWPSVHIHKITILDKKQDIEKDKTIGSYPLMNHTDYYNINYQSACPNYIDFCPIKQTCCSISNYRYGCCPLDNAVCCDDHKSCCPPKTICIKGGCKYQN